MTNPIVTFKDYLLKKTKVYQELNKRNQINWEWILLINNFCQVPKAGMKPNQIAQFKGAARIKIALKYALEGKSVAEAFAEQQKSQPDLKKINQTIRTQHAITHDKETQASNERKQQESQAAAGY